MAKLEYYSLLEAFKMKHEDRDPHPFHLAKNFKIICYNVVVDKPADESAAYTELEIVPQKTCL